MDKIISKLSSLDSLKKFFSYGDRIHPARDWYVLLVITVLFLLIGIAANVYLFEELVNGKNLGAATTVPHQAVGDSVTAVQTLFQERATEENNYQSTYHFVDPSLSGS